MEDRCTVSIRAVLERLGVLEPRDPEVAANREIAMKINEEARAEIHASRARRAVLQLRHEQILRHQRRER